MLDYIPPQQSRSSKLFTTDAVVSPHYVIGKIGKIECPMLLDNGADVTVVNESLVSEERYTPGAIRIRDVNKGDVSHRKASRVRTAGINSFNLGHPFLPLPSLFGVVLVWALIYLMSFDPAAKASRDPTTTFLATWTTSLTPSLVIASLTPFL